MIYGVLCDTYTGQICLFSRYTQFDDLTNIEKKYVKNLAYKSFSNLLSPILFGKSNFDLAANLKGNFSIWTFFVAFR